MRTDEAMHVEDLHSTLRAKIESDAKEIAALRKALEKCCDLAGREHGHGNITDYVDIFLTAKQALDVYEQDVGK
jgi:hypothetical protein